MSRVNSNLIDVFIKQLYLVELHQELASKNKNNQLVEMTEALQLITETILHSNTACLTSIDEDSINVELERDYLQASTEELSDLDPYDDGSLNNIQ